VSNELRCKTIREDIVREEEFRDTLRKLDNKDIIKGDYKTSLHGESITQTFDIHCKRIQCLLCVLWVFGKRISEVLLLKRRDVWVEDGFLYVRFIVRKKGPLMRKRRNFPARFLKKITLKNPHVKYITAYIETLNDPNAYLFPGRSRPRTYRTKVEGKTYTYTRNESGFMSSNLAWKIIKYLNPMLYPHLFRQSVATLLAEDGLTEDQLMSWFDWDSSRVAHEYVKRGPKLSERASMREW